jgi:hypothetical protein
VVVNSGTGSIVLRGSTPTTGITIVAGERCVAAWNGSDFTKVASSVADGVTSVGGTGTVNGITLTGTVTSTGNLTLGGTLSGVNLASQVTGTLPVANGGTGITSLGAGVATFLGTPSSANLAAALTDETGSGSAVFATSPTLVTPILGTPTSVTLTNATGLPLTTGVTGTLPIANGGTGQTTANTAFNALVPSQTSNSGKFLTTNGSDTSWATVGGGGAYSQGTWTPSIRVGGSATGITYVGQSGIYTKIGDMVTLRGYMFIDNLPTFSPSDQVTVVGLPFAGEGDIFGDGDVIFFWADAVTVSNLIFGHVTGSTIRIFSGTYAPITRSQFQSGVLSFRATYYAEP